MGKIVYVLTAVILSKKKFNQTLSYICSMCLYCIGKVSIAPIKAVVGVDRPMKAPSMHIQKPYWLQALTFCLKYLSCIIEPRHEISNNLTFLQV